MDKLRLFEKMGARISSRKLDRMTVLAFENGMRLHRDAILLYKNGSYPSAYFLSVLSMEELGKSLALEEYLWRNATEGKASQKIERKLIEALYNHKYKQIRFAWNIDVPGFCRKAIQNIFDGNAEVDKQEATYVGLQRNRNKINYKGKIVNPLKLHARKASSQITVVNDFLVVLAIGCIKGTHSMDLIGLEALFTHALVTELRTNWPIMSRTAKHQYSQIMKYNNLSAEGRGLASH